MELNSHHKVTLYCDRNLQNCLYNAIELPISNKTIKSQLTRYILHYYTIRMNMVIKHVFEICAHMLADLRCTCHTPNSAQHNAYSYIYLYMSCN